MKRRLNLLCAAALAVVALLPVLGEDAATATGNPQTVEAPCGVVEGFDFPYPDVDTTRTDFARYRERFGGLHVGIDVAFNDYGKPVRTAARGRVTYSDIEGWDTEKGVVVVQHTFPDGTLINTLYGHMEEINGYIFPPEESCVERGDIVGAVGDPSLSLPHLHYEVRTRYPHEGGPGYTLTNPLELGWLHPVDFSYVARLWIHPAYRAHFSMAEPLSAAPVLLPDGQIVVAHDGYLEGVLSGGRQMWRFDIVSGTAHLLALPDGRVLAITDDDQALVVDHGRYSGLWVFDAPVSGVMLAGERVIAILDERTIAGYALDGGRLWTAGPVQGDLLHWASSGDRLAFGSGAGELLVLSLDGAVLLQRTLADTPIPFAGAAGTFYVLAGASLGRLDRSLALASLAELPRSVTAAAQGITAPAGDRLYVYPGEGRSIYAYDAAGQMVWIGYLPGAEMRLPKLAIGGGELLYALTAAGELLSFSLADGRLLDQVALYVGGDNAVESARWLAVAPDESIHFSGGYLTVATLDGAQFLSPDVQAN